MTDKQKLEAQIEQNQLDREKIVIEGDRLQAELKACGSGLKHGDYGLDNGQACSPKERLFLKKFKDNSVYACNHNGTTEGYTVFNGCEIVVLGNIFADLKMLSEPLESFDVDGCAKFTGMKVFRTQSLINFEMCASVRSFPINEAEEISNNLRRLIATARMRDK